jgi:DNA-binding response OmpR family regulator
LEKDKSEGATVPADQRSETNAAGEVVILCGEEEVRDVIVHWFTSLPASTTIAEDGYHANTILRERNCRLLVTDRVIPPWPGLDTFRTLRDRNPDLRVAFVDNGNIHDRILARIVGATDYFSRPLNRRTVIEALTRAEPAL